LPFRTQLQEMEKRMALYQILNAKEWSICKHF
jgi:hypothetical protein